MKKTSLIFKSVIVIVAVTTFISCKKEIGHPKNEFGARYNTTTAAHVTDLSPMAKTKTPGNGYVGTSTLGDSTSATK